MQADIVIPPSAPMRAAVKKVTTTIWPAASATLAVIALLGLIVTVAVTQLANMTLQSQQSPVRWFEEYARAGSVVYGGDFVVLPSILHDMSAVMWKGRWVRVSLRHVLRHGDEVSAPLLATGRWHRPAVPHGRQRR